jgi:hypothetical protein
LLRGFNVAAFPARPDFTFPENALNVMSKGGSGRSIEEHDAQWGVEMLEFAANTTITGTLQSVGRTVLDARIPGLAARSPS